MPRKKLSDKQKLKIIKEYVRETRKSRGIVDLPGPLFETSCLGLDGGGEFRNLLVRNLMFTPESRWGEIHNPEVLHGVYRQVFEERRRERVNAK